MNRKILLHRDQEYFNCAGLVTVKPKEKMYSKWIFERTNKNFYRNAIHFDTSANRIFFRRIFFFRLFFIFGVFRGDEEQTYNNGPAGMEPDGLIESNWTEVVDNFDDMNLKEELLRGIYAYGFERPSAIQQRAILPCIKEHDVIAQAQSGKLNSIFFSMN